MNSCHVLQDCARIRGLPVKSRLQPHARFACESLADPELARQFLHCFLPPDVSAMLSFDGLRRENADFIDEKLKEHRSDLLFSLESAQGGRIQMYILMEHKSAPDAGVHLQILRYMREILERMKPLGPLIPIVLYHGKDNWKVAGSFRSLLKLTPEEREVFYRFILNFRLILADVRALNLDGMRMPALLRVFLYALKHIHELRDREKLRKLLRLSADLFRRRDLKFVERLLSYVYNVHDYQAAEIRDIIEEEIGPEEGGIAMTTVQKLIQEGLEQGLEQGVEQGMKQARLEDARNFLKNGVPLEVVIKSIGLSEEELRKEGILN